MKLALMLGALSVVLGLTSNALACDKAKHQKETASKKTTKAQAGEKGATYLTGSWIKQDVRRDGRITSGAKNVQVLDKKDIERSGQSTVGDFLRQQGVTR